MREEMRLHNNEGEKNLSRPLLADLTDREGVELCAQLRRELVADVSKTWS